VKNDFPYKGSSAALASAIVLVFGCTSPDETQVGSSVDPVIGYNGNDLNGNDLNGNDLNGTSAPGTVTIWTSLEGVVLNGSTLDSATLSASVFSGTQSGTNLSGTDFIGAQFSAMRGDGTSVTLRLASIASQTPSRWSYNFEYLEDDSQWYPICHNTDGPLAAYPLEGTWNYQIGPTGASHSNDPTKFTLACRTRGALAKCIDDGYEPWSSFNGTSLADHHQACVRMIRADYCGTGESYTTNGRLVNLYDGLGVQTDTETFGFEAEWTPNGASCFTTHRRGPADVPCFDPNLEAGCGDLAHFNAGTLIMNEIP